MTDAKMAHPRPARSEDANALRQLVVEAYTHYIARMGKPPGPMMDDYDQRVADGQVWVLEADGTIVGLIVLEEAGDTLLLDNVAVSPAAQGKGYGRTLIDFAEQEARRLGYAELRLYTNVHMTENIALYERLGFLQTGRVSEKGFERVYMAKTLG